MPYYSEKEYEGPEFIVVAMDIGTTQSAVSFAYFSPGHKAQERTVASWPGSSWTLSDKTPSMVSYRDGVVKACGAEALQDFAEHPENVAYRFKLHLHPALFSQSHLSDSEIPPLPVGITIERVYADMMGYLMENTQRSFERTNPHGTEVWARLRNTIVIVLVTPNGWDIQEQATLRRSAIGASLVTEENAGQLLQFVTESEASVHYVLAYHPGEWLRTNTVFAVVDCGRSTVETAVYRCVSVSPLSLKETCPSEYIQAGGVFLNRGVKKMLESKLEGSAFSDPNIILSMTNAFERELKPIFDGIQHQYELKFGGIRDNEPGLGIDRGKIALSNEDLKPVFDAVTDKICNSCSGVLPNHKAKYVLLVGEFGDSPYVQKVLSKRLRSHEMQIITIQDYGRKAAPKGAIIGHIKQFVVARAVQATFGGCVRQIYERSLHRGRRHEVYADGKKRVDGVFHVWIKKRTVLQGTFAHKIPYHVAWDANSTSESDLRGKLGAIEVEVFAWERDGIPKWCKDEQGGVMKGMRLICTLTADLSSLAGGLLITTGPRGERFYRVDYAVCFYFGGTQLRAKIQWRERGVHREGPVTVMPYVSSGEHPGASGVSPLLRPPEKNERKLNPSPGDASLLTTSRPIVHESQVKVMPTAEEKSDKLMPSENLSIPNVDEPPSKVTTARDDPTASQVIPSLPELPESDGSYSPDPTMRPPPAATLQRPSREVPISTPPSSIQGRPGLISTLKHTVAGEIRGSNSSPYLLHEQTQSLGPNSTVGAHASIGSTKQIHSFDSNSASVSIAQRPDPEETVRLRNPNNGVSSAEGDGVCTNLEKLMEDHVPCDLSGQVVIPDRGNPAQGGLADVHFGLFDKKEVAVKVLRIRKSRKTNAYWEASNERRITREMHVWSALKHRNICEFLGYSKDFSDYPAMISMWCNRGTVDDYLESRKLSVNERIRLTLDVSEGLCYLHDLKIVHGDLKPNNVLVDDTCVARLCDFGLVRLVDWEGPAGMTTTSPYTGTVRYKAPELFVSVDNGHPVATFEGDMYSLGCVMLEFIELLYPFERFERATDLRKAILDGHYPALRSETTGALSDMTGYFWNLLEACWSDPSSRPSIKEVIEALHDFARSMPPLSADLSVLRTQSELRESQVKMRPTTERSDESMCCENLRIPDQDGPREATMAEDNPLASRATCPPSDLPESDIPYSPDDTILPPPAATLKRPSREALISTVSSIAQSGPGLISTPKYTVASEIKASNLSPDLLHEQNQSLRPNSSLGEHTFVGSASQAGYFNSNQASVSRAQKTDAEEIVESHNPSTSTPFAEGDGVSTPLAKLMIDYIPRDLSGKVTIPDRGNVVHGGLADVYLGWFDKKEVAVKVLRMRKSKWPEPELEASNERRIMGEIRVWSALKHRNICEFLGYSRDLSDYPAMISTWCRHGTVYDYLSTQILSVKDRIQLALDVCEGLRYLHDLKVVHGDLKPTNVLVDDTGVARLCGFGLVRVVEGPAGMNTRSACTGTERYKAPELLFSRDNRNPVATFEGDMYSLGCVMFEFIELHHPFKRFERATDLRNAIMNRQSPALRSETTRPLFDMTHLFWDLLEACWEDPSERPSIMQVIEVLQVFKCTTS